jgi:Kef-type K+ transport system membrane component KefB
MTTHDALVLLLLAIGVFLAPPLSVRLHVPTAVGEMLYGAVLVAVVPAMRHTPAFVDFLQQFGFLFVLFLAGLELNSRTILSAGPGRFLRALPFAIAIPFGCMAGATLLHYPAVLGLIVGTISIGIATRVLADLGLLRTPFGQTAILTGGLGELVTIMAITIISETVRGLNSVHLITALAKLIVIFAAGFVAIALLRDLAWWKPAWFGRVVATEDAAETGMRSALGLLAAFAAIAALLGIPSALAAFVAGQVLGFLFPPNAAALDASGSQTLRAKLKSLGFSFFVPVAFITVGQHIDLRALLQPGPLMLGLGMTVASGLARFIALPLLRLQTDWDDAILTAVLLSESLTMKVTVAQLGVSMHAISASVLTPAIAATTAGDVMFTILFRFLIQRRRTIETTRAALHAEPVALGTG